MSPTIRLGSPATAEDVLRFLESDLQSRAGISDGTVALEFAVRLSPSQGAPFPLRIKVWRSDVAAEPFSWITSHYAVTPTDAHLTARSHTYGKDVFDALANAIRSVTVPINTALESGASFTPAWLQADPSYVNTPGFGR